MSESFLNTPEGLVVKRLTTGVFQIEMNRRRLAFVSCLLRQWNAQPCETV